MKKVVIGIMHYIRPEILSQTDMTINTILKENRQQIIKTNSGGSCCFDQDEQIDIQKIHERWWEWIFSTADGPGHPLKGNHAVKQAQNGVYLLAGTLPKEEKELQQAERRQIAIPVGASVFIAVDNVLCTETEGDPIPLDAVCAKRDADDAIGKILARLNDQNLEPIRIQPAQI